MNIEEANDNLIMLKYFLQEEGDENWEKYCEAIETLLTAYEKEKEKNNNARDIIEYYLIENYSLNDFDKRNKELKKLEKVLEE